MPRARASGPTAYPLALSTEIQKTFPRLFVFLTIFMQRVCGVRPTFTSCNHVRPSRSPIAFVPMSTGDQTTSSFNANFTKIFGAATNKYKAVVGQDLGVNPFVGALEKYSSPDDILGLFRIQAQGFDRVYKCSEKLMTYLTQIVHILLTVSATTNGLVFVSPSSFLYYSVMGSTFSQSRPQSQSLQGFAFFSG